MRTYSSFILLCLWSISILSCKEKSAQIDSLKVVEKLNKIDSTLIIGDPLDCGIKDILFFPVGCNYSPETFEKEEADIKNDLKTVSFASNSSTTLIYDRYAKNEYHNEYTDQQDIRNILFYNQNNKKSFPLFNGVAHILSFAIHKEFKNNLILYRIVLKDINKDHLFNSEDPIVLYASDLEGGNLTPLSPVNEQFVDYFYYENTNKILIKTKIDSDKNQKFTSTDETNFREVDLLNPKMGIEIFDSNTKTILRKNIGIE